MYQSCTKKKYIPVTYEEKSVLKINTLLLHNEFYYMSFYQRANFSEGNNGQKWLNSTDTALNSTSLH